MLLAQVFLLLCLSSMGCCYILVFSTKADEFCTNDCFMLGQETESVSCNPNTTKTRRVCLMAGIDEVLRIRPDSAERWRVLKVSDAQTVDLEPTKLFKKLYLENVTKIKVDNDHSTNREDSFSYLSLKDSQIEDKYTLAFDSLKELHIDNSNTGVINQDSIDEIDIINSSTIKKLSAGIEDRNSAFHDSKIDEITKLDIKNTATISMKNMTITNVLDLKYSSSKSSIVSSTYIGKITSFTVQPSSGTLEFNEVEVGEIGASGLLVMGKVQMTDSIIYKSHFNGIVINGSGEITFSNVTVNGVQLSYTVKADPMTNTTLNALHPSKMICSYITYWIIIVVLVTVSLILLFFVIKMAMTQRRSSAADDTENINLKSKDTGKVPKNHYTEKLSSQDIPMAPRNEAVPTIQADRKKIGPIPSPPELVKSSIDSKSVPDLPPPPPPQPLYIDVNAGEQDVKSSFLHSLNAATAGQNKNISPGLNFRQNGQSGPNSEAPSHSVRPAASRPNPALPTPALPPIASHYATRGQVKPPPPPRNPPTSRFMSQQPAVEFQPNPLPPPPPMADYQDTVDDEPLYASEDELRNY